MLQPRRQVAFALLAAGATLGAALATAQGISPRSRGYPYQTGKELYERVCAGCHMPDGKGATGAGTYPALAGNRKLQTPVYPAIVMLRGFKNMAPFSELNDQQIAEVANYVRSSFGNSFAGTVSAEQVAKLRPQQVEFQGRRPG